MTYEQTESNGLAFGTLTLADVDEGLCEAVVAMLLLQPSCTFAAYDRPHPDVNKHVLRFGGDGDPQSLWKCAIASMITTLEGIECKQNDCKEEDSVDVIVTPAVVEVVNALRRIIINNVPVHAFTQFEVYANSSSMPDEVLIRRLGQLPLRHEEHDVVIMTLDASLPALTEQVAIAHRLSKCFSHWRRRPITKKPKLHSWRCIYHNDCSAVSVSGGAIHIGSGNEDDAAALLELWPGQCVSLKATSTLGTGSLHARYCCATSFDWSRVEDGQMTFSSIGQLPAIDIVEIAKRRLVAVLSDLIDSDFFSTR